MLFVTEVYDRGLRQMLRMICMYIDIDMNMDMDMAYRTDNFR